MTYVLVVGLANPVVFPPVATVPGRANRTAALGLGSMRRYSLGRVRERCGGRSTFRCVMRQTNCQPCHREFLHVRNQHDNRPD